MTFDSESYIRLRQWHLTVIYYSDSDYLTRKVTPDSESDIWLWQWYLTQTAISDLDSDVLFKTVNTWLRQWHPTQTVISYSESDIWPGQWHLTQDSDIWLKTVTIWLGTVTSDSEQWHLTHDNDIWLKTVTSDSDRFGEEQLKTNWRIWGKTGQQSDLIGGCSSRSLIREEEWTSIFFIYLSVNKNLTWTSWKQSINHPSFLLNDTVFYIRGFQTIFRLAVHFASWVTSLASPKFIPVMWFWCPVPLLSP